MHRGADWEAISTVGGDANMTWVRRASTVIWHRTFAGFGAEKSPAASVVLPKGQAITKPIRK